MIVGCLGHFKLLQGNKLPPWFCHLGNQYGTITVKSNGSYSLISRLLKLQAIVYACPLLAGLSM